MQNETNKTPRTVVAIDVGYGNTKVVFGHGLGKGGKSRWMETVFPSIAPTVVMDEEATGFGSNPDRILIEHNGQRFYAGPKATSGFVPRVIEPNYIETDLHEVLLKAALHMAMRELGRPLLEIDMLVLGLPVSGFAVQREMLQRIGLSSRSVPVPKALRHLCGDQDSIEVKVKQCAVFPQPYGSMRLAAQTLPPLDPLFDENVLSMVVDPGYRTLDWYVAAGMKPELKLSGSYDGGVSQILREISQRIGYEQGTGSLEFDLVERGLSTGKITLGGYKTIDMAPYQALVPKLAAIEVGNFATRLGSRAASVARVIVAGGGAQFYEEAIRARFAECELITVDDPLMSNARGYWLAGNDRLQD